MAFPQIVTNTTSEEQNAVTSHTVDLPSGIVSGNLLLVFFSTDESPVVAWPAGWTQFFSKSGHGTDCKIFAAYRQADGLEGSTITVTTSAGGDSSGSEPSAHASYRISGAEDPSTQAPEGSSGATGSTINPDPDSLTPTGGAKDYLWIAAVSTNNTTTYSSAPTGYSNFLTIVTSQNGIGTADRENNATSENPGAFTLSGSTRWGAGTIAVHPESGSIIPLIVHHRQQLVRH